jgi:hypothetical protein
MRRRGFVPLLPLVLACGDPGGPVVGAYMLTAIDDVPVPHLVAATATCDEMVVSGSLILESAGTFILQVRQAQDCSATGGSVDTFATTVAGAYTVAGPHLTLKPIGSGLAYRGTRIPGGISLQLPPFPFISAAPHWATFLIFPL